ncbi:hypothetical protein KC318_g6878 [Hortaea werneckii]|uniref:LRAT domain-containing protein n=1 Tax=Hortaea werneckii TaxID=91943 RepID=A0A3M6YZ30_HORWE|nr:hypothetical protein KC334_g3050 [Hortaea werneckii]KAI7006681.1 hypothetical protein KC355_g7640 [Hortaea werneckii]KAI7665817.1 hypothetical protein KC318_g6878 [Hortaea werneckii]RMY08274.1 hypothetical protein D0867_09087 [Hortaea werneckii]RMY27507.1 hypothetical protein D0866_10098 [Hortaea werneckii]
MSSHYRAIQLVHRDLQASPLSANARRSELSASKGKSLPGHSSPSVYAEESKKIYLPALVSHWAMRIENSPEKGREDDIGTWTYFGLVSPDSKKCELDEEQWKVLGSPISRACGSTSEDDDEIRNMALSAIDEFGAYDLMTNNCQDFALYLFLKVANFIEHPQRLLELASARRPASRSLLTVQRNQCKQELSGVDGVTQIFDEIVANDRKGQRIFTWLIGSDFELEDDMYGDRKLDFSLAYPHLRPEVDKPYRRLNVSYQLD